MYRVVCVQRIKLVSKIYIINLENVKKLTIHSHTHYIEKRGFLLYNIEWLQKGGEVSMKVKVVSLFSGIGGFEEAFKNSKLEHEVVFASEIDKFARSA